MSDHSLKKTEKKYPIATAEIAQIFGLPESSIAEGALPVVSDKDSSGHVPGFSNAAGNLPVKDLPVLDSHTPENIPHVAGLSEARPVQKDLTKNIAALTGSGKIPPTGHMNDANLLNQNPGGSKFVKFLKNIAPYVAVFSIGIFLYFFFFTKTDFSKIFNIKPKAETPQQSAIKQLESKSMVGYQNWISGFYFDVSDPEVLNPDADNSGNGLSNFQKYLLNLNPKSYDTLGLGMADSEALAQGINPLTGGKLNENQKNIISKYFDMEVIMNRLALSQLQKNGQVAGTNVGINNSMGAYRSFGSQPAQSGNVNANVAANGNVDPVMLSESDVNTSIPGRLEIPDLGVNVPIIWSSDPKNFEQDLKSGVVHYPGTAMPGQIGTAYISGHSSNYAWAKGNYNKVFSKLGDLADNTSFKITVVNKSGKDVIYHYVVVGRQQYDAKDQAQFRNAGQSVVALSTCWPVGTTAKRLVVYGQMTQVENK